MEEVVAVGEAGPRIDRWIEDGQGVLGVLPGFFDEHEQLRAGLEAAERECVRLREEVDMLRAENGGLRGEREEIAETIAEGLNEVMNEALQRLRVPFRTSRELEANPTYA
jgi:hypothetical protein